MRNCLHSNQFAVRSRGCSKSRLFVVICESGSYADNQKASLVINRMRRSSVRPVLQLRSVVRSGCGGCIAVLLPADPRRLSRLRHLLSDPFMVIIEVMLQQQQNPLLPDSDILRIRDRDFIPHHSRHTCRPSGPWL